MTLSHYLTHKKTVAAIVLVSAAVLLAAFLIFRRGTALPRRGAEFPPLPRLNAALAAAQEKLKANPQDITALVETGTLHFQKGKEFYPEAINELEEARDLGALDARIFYCLGIMYQEAGLYPFALEEYQRFLRHYPKDKEIRMLEAKLLYKQGSFQEAVSEYERLKFHFPGDPLVEENLGLSLWGAKSTDRAVDSFNHLKTLGGDQAKRAEFYLGQIAFEKGQFEAALEHLLQCQPLEASPVSFGIPTDRLHATLAAAYQKLDRIEEAKAQWQKVLLDVPDDAKAKAALKELNRRRPAAKAARSKKP